jgi:hypothetical protein
MANFWRKSALNNKKEQKPQSERDPEWLADYQKNNLGTQRKVSGVFWKEVETKIAEKEASPQLERPLGDQRSSKEKKRSKEEGWEVSLSDDSWYKAPQFRPEVRG